MSSSSRRHRAKPTPAPAVQAARDWAALPLDILFAVFLKLGPREVMLGAELACTAWRHVALSDPALWRRVGVDPATATTRDGRRCRRRVDHDVGLETAMSLVAVGRAASQCEAFKGCCDDEDLFTLVERAPSLKSLDLKYLADDYSIEELIEALEERPLLEDLQIHTPHAMEYKRDENLLQSVCRACPQLKTLVLTYPLSSDLGCHENEFDKELIDEEIPVMPKLKSLKLYECELYRYGLKCVLDSCPLLETLCITGYFESGEREMDEELRVKCARVKNLALPTRDIPEPSRDSFSDYWCDALSESSEDYSDGYEDYSEGSSE